MIPHKPFECGAENMHLTTGELARIRKLEFIHSIGLIPVLRMNAGNDNGGDRSEEGVISNCKNDGGGGGSSVETEVNSTDSTDPEQSDEDDEDSTIGSTSHDNYLESNRDTTIRVVVQRKSYQEILEENERMRQLLDANTTQIAELKRLHDVIVDENSLLSLELQEVQKTAKEQKTKLETDLQRNIKVKDFLHRRVEKLKGGIRDLNKTLLGVIMQINGTTSDQESSMETSMTPFLPHRSSTSSRSSSSGPSCSAELQIVLRRLDEESSLNAISPQVSFSDNYGRGQLSSRLTEDESPIPAPRRSHRQLPFTQQINRCLESVPKLLPTRPKFKKERVKFEKEEKFKADSLIRKNSKYPHAVDTSKEKQGFFCICGVNVTTKLGLMTHIHYHTFEGQFRCAVKGCGRRYFSTSCLRSHMKAKHGLVYTGREGCRKCGQTFLSRMQLYIHCKNVHNCGPLLAHLKNKNQSTFTSSSASSTPPKEVANDNHQLEHPNPSNIYKGRVKNEKLYRIRHEVDLSKEAEGGPIRCICGREFSSNRNLRCHIKYFTYQPRFGCSVCGNLYNGTNLLRQHMKTKHGMTYAGYGCRTCGRVFKNIATLYRHCNTAHKIGPFYKGRPRSKSEVIKRVQEATAAVVAGVSSKRQRKIPVKYIEESEAEADNVARNHNRHISRLQSQHPLHAEDLSDTNVIKCTCGTTFRTRYSLLGHIKLRTSGNIFKCIYCPTRFPRRDYLEKHVNIFHPDSVINKKDTSSGVAHNTGIQKPSTSGIENFSLNVSPTTMDTRRHGVASSDVVNKRFTCKCGLEFVRHDTLRQHIRLKLGLTQFKCDICDETFWRHDYLKTHLQRAHSICMSGFACRICGRVGFPSSNEVKKHHSIHHSNIDQDSLCSVLP